MMSADIAASMAAVASSSLAHASAGAAKLACRVAASIAWLRAVEQSLHVEYAAVVDLDDDVANS